MAGVLRIATRKSELALWQARHVAERLKERHSGIGIELVPLTTRGDRMLSASLAKVGGKGLFLKELERALLQGKADIAVHSMKDVPVELTPGLTIDVVLERANPFDAWLSRTGERPQDLTAGARIGTSSLRRQCQLLSLRPDLRVEPLRGNLNTRLDKLDAGEYDAIILACAGLERLGLADRITAVLDAPGWLPAAAQGVIGVQARSGDERVASLIDPLNHEPTARTTSAERGVADRLQGSCQLPLAAWADAGDDGSLSLHALVGEPDGSAMPRCVVASDRGDPEEAAGRAAKALIDQGADAIIRKLLS